MTKVFHRLNLTIQHTVKRLGGREPGMTAVEYGLMVALIVIIVITAIAVFGERVLGIFDN